MKYFFLLIITAWSVTAISLCSCKKEPKYIEFQPEDTVYVDEEFKRYWAFPDGSWWIYKRTDTTAEVYDTVTNYKTKREIIADPEASSKAYELIMKYLSHSSRYFYDSSTERDIENKGIILQRISNKFFAKPHINSDINVFFHYDFLLYWPIEDNYNSDIKDTNSINLQIGKIENVLHIKQRSESEIWIAKGIGFIKYIHKKNPGYGIPKNSEWELVNYHINK